MTEKRILVVEDDTDIQEMVATVLQHMKFNVDVADDGNQASEILSSGSVSYDAIVIDLALSGKDGWALLNEILDNPKTQNLPCIAITAFHTSKLREEAIQAGFTAYFPKPLDGMMLGRELDRMI